MGVRLLLDEHVEHEVAHRLEQRGYDAEHVGTSEEMGTSVDDLSVAAYSKASRRVIVTYDDDFVTEIGEGEFHCVLFFEDEGLSPAEVAEVVHNISTTYPESQFRGLQKVGREWLR